MAKIMYFEGRPVHEISEKTGISLGSMNYFIYRCNPIPWKQLRENFRQAAKDKILSVSTEVASNYLDALKKGSEQLLQDIKNGTQNLGLSEQMIISKLASDNIKNVVNLRLEEMQKNENENQKPNVKINITTEEAVNIMANDPARENENGQITDGEKNISDGEIVIEHEP